MPIPEDADPSQRVLAVKIDNFPFARPQSGIEQADLMMEIWVEGVTRFISFWHTSDTDYLGPIRSIRPTDPGLVKPLGAAVVNSGGQAWVKGEFAAMDIPIIGEVRPETFRIPERNAPHNLYGDTSALRDRDKRDDPEEPLEPLWNFGKTPKDAEEATEIRTDWPFDFFTEWEWDGEVYLKSTKGEPHEWLDPAPGQHESVDDESDKDRSEDDKNSSDTTEGEDTTTTTEESTTTTSSDERTETTEPVEPIQEQIEADTVIIMEMNQYTASGSSGTSLPATETTGEGPAYVFSDGKVQVGTWQRETVDDWFTLTDENGDEMVVKPGRIWMQMPPTDGVTFE